MVFVRKSQGSKSASTAPLFLVVLVIVFAAIFGLGRTNSALSQVTLETSDQKVLSVLLVDPEMQAMRDWRHALQSSCTQFLNSIGEANITNAHLETKEVLEAQALNRLAISEQDSLVIDSNRPKYQFCQHAFFDLGTNRGDSIGCAVDASLDVCSDDFLLKDPSIRKAYRISRDFPRLHLDVNDLKMYGKGNQGLSLLRLLRDFFDGPGMESVCVYGMEGNPYFTEKLQKLNALVNGMRPRPLKHLHIHTETIVSPKDGPSSLYIDQYSEKNHFWGSSVLQSMPDIRRTSRQNNGTMVQAKVEGITLSTLMKKTLTPFDNNKGNSEFSGGGSLLVKMDVEGAEFGILKEVANTGVLCDYVKHGNNATMVVEFHQHLIKDPEEKRLVLAGVKEAKETLRTCGVKFRQLPNFWT